MYEINLYRALPNYDCYSLKMRTRRAIYPSPAHISCLENRLRRPLPTPNEAPSSQRAAKKAKISLLQIDNTVSYSSFDTLPDDLLLSIFVALSSSADSPADLINLVLTCKRCQKLAFSPIVLANASVAALRVRASRWCDGASSFLSRCKDAGNVEACYILGMIRFYCLMDREGGLEMMAAAAGRSHADALHSMAVIQFNGSGGGRADKNLKAGVRLCARAASLKHVDAMRELGHCLQDGYGVPKNVIDGRRMIVEANAREASAAVAGKSETLHRQLPPPNDRLMMGGCRQHLNARSKAPLIAAHIGGLLHHPIYRFLHAGGCSLFSDFGCNVPAPKLHVAHEFLLAWFQTHPLLSGLRLCSHPSCGRPETRQHEFRRCSACGFVNYCSRACQALDWKLQHKLNCDRMANWQGNAMAAIVGLVGGGAAPLYFN